VPKLPEVVAVPLQLVLCKYPVAVSVNVTPLGEEYTLTLPSVKVMAATGVS
jgi:hypothetical protein